MDRILAGVDASVNEKSSISRSAVFGVDHTDPFPTWILFLPNGEYSLANIWACGVCDVDRSNKLDDYW